MEIDQLLTLIDKVSSSKLSDFCFEEGNVKISMKKKQRIVSAGAGAKNTFVTNVELDQIADDEESVQTVGTQIKAPLVGTFYNASSPDAEPFVQVGDTVKKGQVLGIIEAMKLMNEIECDCNGVVKEILVENEQMVEYGQTIFVIQ